MEILVLYLHFAYYKVMVKHITETEAKDACDKEGREPCME